MTRGTIFWLMMILWFLAILGVVFEIVPLKYGYASNVFLLIVIGLLGWDVYGPAVRGK